MAGYYSVFGGGRGKGRVVARRQGSTGSPIGIETSTTNGAARRPVDFTHPTDRLGIGVLFGDDCHGLPFKAVLAKTVPEESE
ncbi:MAG: hypothetical protein TUN42_06720 [Dehalogenimonas sp.]